MKYKLPIFITAIVCLSVFLLTNGCLNSDRRIEPKAAIIDQLSKLEPNQPFIDQTTNLLANHGLQVDVYRGDEINVDFLRQLPGQGYRLIIFRAHSGLLGAEGKVIARTCLFTNENYSESKHIPDQLQARLAKARINPDYPWVFAAGAGFISSSSKGNFDHSVIIMMGCSTLYIDDMARAFIKKGAGVYFGWDASVGLDYVDVATVTLLKNLWSSGSTVESAVAATIKEIGTDPDFGATLKYFPQERRNQNALMDTRSK